MRSCYARTCILNIIGGQLLERWPPTFMEKFFGNREFSYKDRMDMGTFLYGNMRDINLVYCANHCASRLAATRRTTTTRVDGWPTSRAASTTSATTTSTCCLPTGTSSAVLSMRIGGCPARMRAL